LVEKLKFVSLNDSSTIAGVISSCVSSVKQQIMEDQSDKLLAPEEVLLDVKVRKITTDIPTLSISFELLVETFGSSAAVTLSAGGAP
jgi:hypothetical protein